MIWKRPCFTYLAVPGAISADWLLVSTMSSSVALCRILGR